MACSAAREVPGLAADQEDADEELRAVIQNDFDPNVSENLESLEAISIGCSIRAG